jgi:hypothetical protein
MTKNCRSSPKGGERYLNVTRRLAAAIGFVGEFMSGDTPDPIPNSEVKPRQPMILLSGKVGHCRLFQPPVLTDWGLSFYIFSFYETAQSKDCLFVFAAIRYTFLFSFLDCTSKHACIANTC